MVDFQKKIEKNRIIFFEIGLIIALLTVWIIIDWETKTKKIVSMESKQTNHIPIDNIIIKFHKLNNHPEKPDPKNLKNYPIKEQTFNVAELNINNILTINEKPKFPGGENALKTYIDKHKIYPKEAYEKNEQGKVFVEVTVDTTGRILDPKIIRSISPLLDSAAILIFEKMPNWIPAKKKQIKTTSKMIIPVSFVKSKYKPEK